MNGSSMAQRTLVTLIGNFECNPTTYHDTVEDLPYMGAWPRLYDETMWSILLSPLVPVGCVKEHYLEVQANVSQVCIQSSNVFFNALNDRLNESS